MRRSTEPGGEVSFSHGRHDRPPWCVNRWVRHTRESESFPNLRHELTSKRSSGPRGRSLGESRPPPPLEQMLPQNGINAERRGRKLSAWRVHRWVTRVRDRVARLPVHNALRNDSRDLVAEVVKQQRFAKARVLYGASELTNSPRTSLHGVNSRRDIALPRRAVLHHFLPPRLRCGSAVGR